MSHRVMNQLHLKVRIRSYVYMLCGSYVRSYSYVLCTSYVELSITSAETVLLTAFGAHFFKEVSRSQLESAAKSLIPLKTIQRGDKRDFIMPLAEAFLKRGVIKIQGSSCDLKNLARGDLKKVGPF